MCVWGVSLSICPVVSLSTDRLESKEDERETDTNRQYMFLICPLWVRERQSKSKIMDATDVSVTNV